jgi:hypothetical protein
MKSTQNYNKILFGGEITTNKQIEIFLSIIILGYFGIKIIYGFFFNYYPDKYYYRNIQINSNEGSGNSEQTTTSNITLNAYVPGVWNNEMTDFITLLVLVAIIYIYTNVSSKSFISIDGILNITFLFGYIIGLGYPAIYKNYISLFNAEENSSTVIKIMHLVILIVFIIVVFILNYMAIDPINSVHKSNYVIYTITIVLVLFGLILSKKNSANYLSTKYFYNDGQSCAFNKYSVIQTSGDVLNITIPFLAFIILLLFSYEPSEISFKNLYVFVYGLLLGILVSSISYYGIEYFLQKKPMKECNNDVECTFKDMPSPPLDTPLSVGQNAAKAILAKQLVTDSNLNKMNISFTRNNSGFIKLIIFIFIILILIYLVYYYFFM